MDLTVDLLEDKVDLMEGLLEDPMGDQGDLMVVEHFKEVERLASTWMGPSGVKYLDKMYK